MSVAVSVAVQHHPLRAHMLDALMARLPDGTEVVTDPQPQGPRSPLRTYLEALRRTPEGATHRLVVQDDALPCDGFPERAIAAIRERPDDLVALFVPGAPPHRAAVLRAEKHGQSWVMLPATWIPTVALCWPVEIAGRFIEWAESTYLPGRRPQHGDDGPVGYFAQRHRLRAWGPLPSLVEHPDVVPSLIGRRAAAGQNRARVAARFDG